MYCNLFTSVMKSHKYLQRSCPSDYTTHIHRAFIIIFETRHTGLIMAALNVLVKLLPSSPFLLSPCFFIGVHHFLSASCSYFHLLNLQLFRERLSEKVHSTIPKGIVGGFECSALQINLKKWHGRPRTYVCEC